MGEEDQELSKSMRDFIDDSSVVDYQPLNRMEVIQMTDSKLKTKVYNADSDDEGGLSDSASHHFDEPDDTAEIDDARDGEMQADVTDQEEERPIDQEDGF